MPGSTIHGDAVDRMPRDLNSSHDHRHVVARLPVYCERRLFAQNSPKRRKKTEKTAITVHF